MKRLLYLVGWAFHITASAQSFPVKNVNDEYAVSGLTNYNTLKKDQVKIVRDNRGRYWFQSAIEVFSFDGINRKPYRLKTISKKNTPFRINDIEVTDDGNIWLATESGIYLLDRNSETFIPVSEKYPGIKGLPLAVSCFYKGSVNNLIFISALDQGFYWLNWKTKKLKQVIIDSSNHVIPPGGEMAGITTDKEGNIWGLSADGDGIWNYNHQTGKIRCSWKGELDQFRHSRFNDVIGINYSHRDNALWLSYGNKGWLEKKFLQTGTSIFFSFSGDLNVHADTAAEKKHPVLFVKTDRNHNEWIKVGRKYLVKLNSNISLFEYLVNDDDLFPVGDWARFEPECVIENSDIKENNILFWMQGAEKIFMIKKRTEAVRHLPFVISPAAGIGSVDYANEDGRKNIFFEKGRNGHYYLLQQNAGRPKLICLDNNLQIKKTLLNDEWKQYPAFFSQDFNADTFYIAIMRPGAEPLDFRNVVIKDFKIDIATFTLQEVKLDFKQRIWRYGYADADNVYWLYSNGSLYSYDPQKNILDSIFICEPSAKGAYRLELVKWYDYPTVLNKKSSTFWIDFIPKRELYKISLKTKKIERIFKCCFDRPDCTIPGGVFDMYNFDTYRIYLQQSYSALLIDAGSDSLTDYIDLFKSKAGNQSPCGSGLYRNWAYFIYPSHIYFFNTLSGVRREFVINQDFKWPISQFNSKPLVNDRGEMILMSSNRGFLVFNIDSLIDAEKPGIVRLSFVKLDNNNLPLDSLMRKNMLSLKYNRYNSIYIGFSDYSVFDPGKINYEYTLYKGGDTVWNRIEGRPELTFSELSSGEYRLLLRAGNSYGDYSGQVTSFGIEIIPPFWQRIWFKILVFALIGSVLYALYRYRLWQMKRLQQIRSNIASDLHDDIGSTLNSISVYSEVAKQQAGKEIPALDLIGSNSRRIIESMSDIVWTINPENDSFEKIIIRMRSFAYQMLKAKNIEFTFDADEKLNVISLPMQVRKNFYLVFKEAVNNLVKYSGATRVSISLCQENKAIVLKIRDNGIGIQVTPETMGNGMLNMKRRAAEIHAALNIETMKEKGTGVELVLKI